MLDLHVWPQKTHDLADELPVAARAEVVNCQPRDQRRLKAARSDPQKATITCLKL